MYKIFQRSKGGFEQTPSTNSLEPPLPMGLTMQMKCNCFVVAKRCMATISDIITVNHILACKQSHLVGLFIDHIAGYKGFLCLPCWSFSPLHGKGCRQVDVWKCWPSTPMQELKHQLHIKIPSFISPLHGMHDVQLFALILEPKSCAHEYNYVVKFFTGWIGSLTT